MKGEIPANTERSTAWAVKIFDNWRKAHIETVTTDLHPEKVFTHEDSGIVSQWLFKFIMEVRNDGALYVVLYYELFRHCML